MSEQHQFEVEVARRLGVNSAIILHMFAFWIKKNEANGRHYHDGCYWTYNSNAAFRKIYPYMSEKVIRNAIKKLKDGGYIKVGDYNKDRMNRPNWYAITDEGYKLLYGQECQKGQDVLPQRAERAAPEGDTHNIDIYSYSSTNSSVSINNGDSAKKGETTSESVSKPDEFSDEIDKIITHLNEKANKSYRLKTEATRKLVRARLRDGYTVEDCKRVIDVKASQWLGTDWEKFLRPSTLFRGSNFESYVNESPRDGGILDSIDWSAYELEEL